MHWTLSAASKSDQPLVRVSWAARSSEGQDSLSRPTDRAPRGAAVQLAVTSSLGGLSANAAAVGRPSNRAAVAILLADMIFLITRCFTKRPSLPHPDAG